MLKNCIERKPEEIKKELSAREFKIIEVVNILKWKSKEPLPVFMLTFDNSENINKIYEITEIMGMKIEIHPLRKSILIPQCKNCQAWGHTKKYCRKEPRCVKCAGQHLTNQCSKPLEVKPKCYNCGMEHPANYRGCIVAQELQAIRNKAMLPKKTQPPTRQDIINLPSRLKGTVSEIATSSCTYADKIKSNVSSQKKENIQKTSSPKESEENILKQLQKILEKLNVQEETNKAILSRLDRLENATFKGATPKLRYGK